MQQIPSSSTPRRRRCDANKHQDEEKMYYRRKVTNSTTLIAAAIGIITTASFDTTNFVSCFTSTSRTPPLLSPVPISLRMLWLSERRSRLSMTLTDPETLLMMDEIKNGKKKKKKKNEKLTRKKSLEKLKENSMFHEDGLIHNDLVDDYVVDFHFADVKRNDYDDDDNDVDMVDQLEVLDSNPSPPIEIIGGPSSSPPSSSSPPLKDDPISTSTTSKTTTSNIPTIKTTTLKRKPTKNRKASTINRSSTMPGFSARDRASSGRRKAFDDGLDIAERLSGNKEIRKKLMSDSASKARRKKESEAMYMSSSAVPKSMIQFTDEIHREERVTPTEEKELGSKTQEAIRLQQLHDDLFESLNREPTDDEWCAAAGKINMEALRSTIEDGIEAKNRLVTSNLRMVQGVVNLYLRNGLGGQYNAGDLMQEGTMALIRAAEKFEPSRGFRFSTYAMYWIRAAVKRSQLNQSRTIPIPQRLHETHKKLLKTEKQLRLELGRAPTRSELALACDLTLDQLDRCMDAMRQRCYSLDDPLDNKKTSSSSSSSSSSSRMEHKETLCNMVSNRVVDEEYRKRQMEFMREDLVKALKRYLLPHEVDLLLLRYGMMDKELLPEGCDEGPLTLAQVSKLVGLKTDKVRRIINRALDKLKPLVAAEWEDFEKYL